MIDTRLTLYIVGIFLAALASAMMAPAIVDLAYEHTNAKAFLYAAACTFFAAICLILGFRSRTFNFTVRSAFVLTPASWLVMAVFASIPFALADIRLSPADAFFEAMSGLTTTGSTILTGLDALSPGVLLWRALLQWIGGIGIIGMAVAVLPFLRIGGMQLFRTESSEKSDAVIARATRLAAGIGFLYLGFTVLMLIALSAAGVPFFDALCHAMTTIATAGFSTHDASIGHYDSATIDVIVTVGMLAGSLPFILYIKALRGNFAAVYGDAQIQWLVGLCAFMIVLIVIWRTANEDVGAGLALREAMFNVVSIVTTTGYATAGYDTWGTFALTAFFFLMFVGGCTGSTCGSIKIFRYQVLFAAIRTHVRRLARPHGIFVPHFNKVPLPDGVAGAVLGFFFVFFVAYGVVAIGLALHGYDLITSMSGAATALTNVGPGLGPIIGPEGSFAPLADSAKWLLSAAMLLGRLELFTVLVLFLPSFWRG